MVLLYTRPRIYVFGFGEETIACSVIEAFEEEEVDIRDEVFGADESLQRVFMQAVGVPTASVLDILSL